MIRDGYVAGADWLRPDSIVFHYFSESLCLGAAARYLSVILLIHLRKLRGSISSNIFSAFEQAIEYPVDSAIDSAEYVAEFVAEFVAESAEYVAEYVAKYATEYAAEYAADSAAGSAAKRAAESAVESAAKRAADCTSFLRVSSPVFNPRRINSYFFAVQYGLIFSILMRACFLANFRSTFSILAPAR